MLPVPMLPASNRWTFVRHACAVVAVAAALGAATTANAATRTWPAENVGGSEANPWDIYEPSNWGGNRPSSSDHLNFSVSELTYLTNSATINTMIADCFQPISGDFVFLGDIYCHVFGDMNSGTTGKKVSVVKKGNWNLKYSLWLAKYENTEMAFTNETGSITVSGGTKKYMNVHIGDGNNSKTTIRNISGDWTINNTKDMVIGGGSGSSVSITSISGNWSVTGTEMEIATGSDSDVSIEKDGGDWTIGHTIRLATGSGANAEFHHRGGSLTLTGGYGIQMGYDSTRCQSLFEISGGVVTNNVFGIGIADNGKAGSESRFVVKGDGEYYSEKAINLGYRSTGYLNVEDHGRVTADHVTFCGDSGCGNGEDCYLNLSGGTLVTKYIDYGSGSANATMTFNGGTLKATVAGTLIAAHTNLSVKVGNGGGTVDTTGFDVTIAADLDNASGETGSMTFDGNDGTVRLAGSVNYTGATYLNERTHIVVKDDATKSAILSHGLTVTKPATGSAKGTYTLLSIADGTDCTAADLASVTLGAGLEGASLEIVDGAITITVSHTVQTWAGASVVSASWNGANWNGGATWESGNDAVFATDGAIADVDAAADAFSLAFNENATVTGTAALTVPNVSVASGKAATIDAPLSGALTKTGAGTLTLGASRAESTVLSEGTLVMSGSGTTIDWTTLTLGTDVAKPVTLHFTNGAAIANMPSEMHLPNDDADKSVSLVKDSGDWTLDKTIRLATGSGSTAEFRHCGGSLTLTGGYGIQMGCDSASCKSLFEISGGAVTNNAWSVGIADYGQAGSESKFVVKGDGEYYSSEKGINLGFRSTGYLNIEDQGRVTADHVTFCGDSGCGSGEDCYLNLSGGTLATKYINYGSGSANATMTFNGGTLKATAAGTLIQAHDNLFVKVGNGGGTIDTAGFDVTIAEGPDNASGETGGMKYVGGGSVTYSAQPAYSGTTTVEVGTMLVVPSAIAGGDKLAFTIPAGLADGVYTVVHISGDSQFADGVLTGAALPGDANAQFRLSGDGKSILCIYGDLDFVWVGGVSGDLSDAANWANGIVPGAGDSCEIAGAAPATLTLGNTFAPSSITFAAGSKAVTIDGERTISGIVAITNNSAVSHVINVPVAFADKIFVVQGAMSWQQKGNPSIRFAGGVTGTTFASGTARYLDGYFTLSTGTDWVANTENPRWGIPNGSSLTTPSTPNTQELIIGEDSARGGAFTAGVVRTSTRLLCFNYGEYVVTNELEFTLQNSVQHCGWDNISKGKFKFEKMTLKGSNDLPFKFGTQNGSSADSGDQYFYIGQGGLCFGSGVNESLRYETGGGKNNMTVHLNPWHGDYTIHKKDAADDNHDFFLSTVSYFGTTDENGEACTVTADAIFNSGSNGAMHIDGSGKFVVNAVNKCGCPVTVHDGATLAINAGKKVTTGEITVESGATLMVGESGTVALDGNLTLHDGAAIGFNWTERNVPVLKLDGKTVTFDEGETTNVVVKVSTTGIARPKSGANVLTSGGGFTGVNVSLADGSPDWALGVSVNDDGEIVVYAKPAPFSLRIR